MPILPYLDYSPVVGEDVRLTNDSYLVGMVHISGPAVLEAKAVLRADQNSITVGPRFRIGAGSTVHVERHTDTRIGADVWIGSDSVVHACTVGEGTRVEDGGLVLSTSNVGAGSIVAADALVSEGVEFPPNSYIAGTPGRRVRETTPEERTETLAMIASSLRDGTRG